MGYVEIGITIAFAVLFYKAGEMESASSGKRNPGFLWAGISIVVSVLFFGVLGTGIFGILICQVLLLIGIAVVRALIDGNN